MATYKKSEQTRQNILDAAYELLSQGTYEDFSIKNLTDTMGIPRSLVYYYFRDKEAIMQVLYETYFRRIDAAVESRVDEDTDPIVIMFAKYALFYRNIVCNPALTDYVIKRKAVVVQGKDTMARMVQSYYADSRRAFERYGLPMNQNDIYVYVTVNDALALAMFQAMTNGTLNMSLREMLTYFGERSVMITFDLPRERFLEIIDEAFRLADSIPPFASSTPAN